MHKDGRVSRWDNLFASSLAEMVVSGLMQEEIQPLALCCVLDIISISLSVTYDCCRNPIQNC